MMKDESKKHILSGSTSNENYVAILSANGIIKIWNTSTRHLLANWKASDGDHDVQYSCIASSFTVRKHKKEKGTCLLALGTIHGRVLVVDVFTGEKKLTTSYTGEICGLSFANKGGVLRIVRQHGMACEVNTETGQLLREFKVSKKSITSLAFSHDGKYLAIVSSKIHIVSWEIGKEVLKLPNDLGNIQHISISNDAKNLVTSDFEGKHLQVWKCDLNSGNVGRGPTLPIRHPPLVLDCHCGWNKEEDIIVLAVTSRGSAYIWNLNAFSEDQIQPTKLITKNKIVETDKENAGSSKKRHISIIASRLQHLEEYNQIKAHVTYGSIDHPQFSVLNISNSGETIVLNVEDETDTVHQHSSASGKEQEVATPMERKKTKKRQAPSDSDVLTTTGKVDLVYNVDQHEPTEGVLLDDDENEPTMGEKLASLCLLDENKVMSDKEQESSISTKPPNADSVHVLLKQALNANDCTLLLDCLYTQDEKVIRKSIAQLNPSNVLKLLYSLISIIESRGAILACALPWLKCLLLKHASGIMSQESSLKALKSLYQPIECRVSTFKSVIQLSSCIDILYSGVIDEEDDEGETLPLIFEDKDSSEEESDEDDMETYQDITDEEQPEQEFDDVSIIDENDDMMEY